VLKTMQLFGAMRWAAALAALLASGGATRARAPEYPLYCAGIVVGMSTDRDVRRMYGPGLYDPEEGHGGGRYYVDLGRRVTLHAELGADDTIDEVSYGRGIRLPARYLKSRRFPSRAISSQLTASEHLYLGIRLGERAADVLQSFGKPRSDTRHGLTRVVRYEADYEQMPYVLDYEAEFRFEYNRLVAVRLYNGE
jgi:hypothetical protein